MKILVVLPRFPYPLEKGDKLRAYHQIRCLSKDNDIYLFALSHNSVDQEAIDQMRHYCKDIRIAQLSRFGGALRVIRNLFSVRSLQIGYWDSSRARRLYRDFEASVQPDVVYAQMVRTMKYVAHSQLPKVLDYQDALSMNLERRMISRRGLAYFVLHYEFKMLRSAEFNATSIFDGLTIISERDSSAIPQHKFTVIDIVPNGVDFDYFHPIETEKKYDVVFCGNMQYKPNVDASRFLVQEVMPLVWRDHPHAKVLLSGATPKNSVKQLASNRVTVSGTVPDIRLSYASAHIMVAPMRIGSGLQNKLLEAMSMGIPCVTTSLANASIGAADGEHLLVGNDAQSLANAITRFLDDKQLRESLSSNASFFVHDRFSWQNACSKLESVLHTAIETHGKHEEEQLDEE